jgi:O-antigen ligase
MLSTQSRGTLVAVFAGIFLIIPRRYLLIMTTLGLIGGIGVLVSGQTEAILALVGRNGDADEALDMAGRAELWKFVWGLIKQRPLLGYGFNSFEVYAGRLWTGQLGAGVAAHNNYLSILYSNGVIGTIPFLATFCILLRRWIFESNPPRDFFVISTLVYGYSEIDMPSFAFVPSQLFFTIMALDAKRRLLQPPPAVDKNNAVAETETLKQEAVL